MKNIGRLSLLDLAKSKTALSPAEMRAIMGGDDEIPISSRYSCAFDSMAYVSSQYGGTSTRSTYVNSYAALYGTSNIASGNFYADQINQVIKDNFQSRPLNQNYDSITTYLNGAKSGCKRFVITDIRTDQSNVRHDVLITRYHQSDDSYDFFDPAVGQTVYNGIKSPQLGNGAVHCRDISGIVYNNPNAN